VSDTYRSGRGRLSKHLWLYSWHSELWSTHAET